MQSSQNTFRQLLEDHSKTNPSKTFAIFPESQTEITFLSLYEESREFALQLAGAGLNKGDRFGIISRNGKFSLTALFGGFYGGFVPVPLNVSAGSLEIAFILNHCEPKLLFATSEHNALIQAIQYKIPPMTFLIPADLHTGVHWKKPSTVSSLRYPSSDDDALLIYTSGSTGRPKGALHSQKGLIASALNTVQMYHLNENDRAYCTLPMYHLNALAVTILPSFLSGGSFVLPSEFNNYFFWKNVCDYRCSWFSLVPTMVKSLFLQNEAPCDPSSIIRFARCSSAPLSPKLQSQFEKRFGIPLIQAMGSTETAGTIFSNPLPPAKRKYGSVGLPQSGWEIQIRDKRGKALQAGQTGELWLWGTNRMKEYYKDQAATASICDDNGWFFVGDLGYFDEDGYFYVSGRKTELINKGGEKIQPSEIENVLQDHPSVQEAACIGRKDEYEAMKICAYVVIGPGCETTEDDLLQFCEKSIGPYKTPDRIVIVPQLPRGPSGKLLRDKLPVV